MKTRAIMILLGLAAAAIAQPERGVILVAPDKEPSPPPLIFSASVDTAVSASADLVTATSRIGFRIRQGEPETLTLPLAGHGEVESVAGEGVRDWAVRRGADGARFLDVRPEPSEEEEEPRFPETLGVTLTTTTPVEDGRAAPLIPAPGEAAGYHLALAVTAEPGVEIEAARADGLSRVAGDAIRFTAAGRAELELAVTSAVLALDAMELTGRLAEDGSAVRFTLRARGEAAAPGACAALLSGAAALESGVSGGGWHVALGADGGYELVATRAGRLDVRLRFDARVTRDGDWRRVDFLMPGGVIVPVSLTGIPARADFAPDEPLVPRPADRDTWAGHLPADGTARFAWREAATPEPGGGLFFTGTADADIRVGGGLLRQSTTLGLQVLQGELDSLVLDLHGPGEVLSLTGAAITGWTVRENPDDDGARLLEVELSRPIQGTAALEIESQTALDALPAETRALRVTPRGALRHSGHLRVAGEGAVRVAVRDAEGLIQLAPGRFPGRPMTDEEALRRAFVYRFPAADHGFAIHASRVVPETSVSEITVYELGESDRRIHADVELDIREAPLREWEILIPSGYAVAAVAGASVADFTTAATPREDGTRALTVTFREPVQGRHLVSLRLERNAGPEAGEWELQPLVHPAARARRGFVGASAAAGFRLTPARTSGLAEVPLTFFPKQTPRLQQAFRIREADWAATLDVEALEQSIQADVFHLHSLKAGTAHTSVVVNYFVVGAPAAEWRVSLPEDAGNVDVTGQHIGRDWRREGDVVIVPLSRPTAGAATLLVTYEQPLSTRGATLATGVARPLGVQSERGFIRVVSPEQVRHTVAAEEGPLLAIDASELPAEFRVLSNAPTLATWQYTGGDIRAEMEVGWYDPGETADRAVDRATLDSRVSRDGEWVTEASFFVKSTGDPALRMTLPEGATLWETTIDGKPVNTRRDGDALLVPLPPAEATGRGVNVRARFGARADQPQRPVLAAPLLDAPVVFADWRVSGDEKRRLIPRDSRAGLVSPVRAETGWQWISRMPLAALAIALMVAASWFAARGGAGVWRVRAARALAAGTGVLALALAGYSWSTGQAHAAVLEFAAPVVAAGEPLALHLANVAPWRAAVGVAAVVTLLAATAVWIAGARMRVPALKPVAAAIAGAAVLSLHGGAPWFFGLFALVCLARLIPAGVAARVLPAASILCLMLAPPLQAAHKPAESITQQWTLSDGRADATLDITVRGDAGDRFLLVAPPAVLGGFTPRHGARLRVVKVPHDGAEAYFLELESDGRAAGRAEFRMPLADPAAGWTIPTGPAALRRIELAWDQPGWEFHSAAAASVTPAHTADASGATLTLTPGDPVKITARPRLRDAAAEETRFFAETHQVFLPASGVVTGRHRIEVRPAQGRVDSLRVLVPGDLTVAGVSGGAAGSWRFDADAGELLVAIEPARESAFHILVETERGTGAPPADLTFAPLRVPDAAGDVGLLAVAFGGDTRPENVVPEGLSRVNPEDPGPDLLPRDDGAPAAVVRDAFRYGEGEASLALRVAPVAPELRSEIRQLVSLGEDRLLVTADVEVEITRAGVFQIDLEIPAALEVESVTGPALGHWSESAAATGDDDDDRRKIHLHLAGRSIGRQVFAITLAGQPPTGEAADRWSVPRVSTAGAARETGVLTVVPDRGFQIRVEDRDNLSQIDPRELAGADHEPARAAARPGALAWRMLQADWALELAIDRLDPWVTATVFQDATLREGQISERLAIIWNIENAAIRAARVRLPGLDEAAASTVRATGPAVADLVRITDDGETDLWEIRFQRGIAGETTAEIEFQRLTGDDAATATLFPARLPGARHTTTYVAARAGGRLDLDASDPPSGWQRADWAVIRTALGRRAGDTPPRFAFRVADADEPLTLALRRHELAGVRRLRVTRGTLTTLLAPDGASLTAVSLEMAATSQSTLRMRLPEGAELFNVSVNDEGAPLVREGDAWMFHVSPPPDPSQPAEVRFVFAGPPEGGRLDGPVLDVPMENLRWHVRVPDGWRLAGHRGDFDLRRTHEPKATREKAYPAKHAKADDGEAMEMLDQAGRWMQSGEQDRAAAALYNVMRNRSLDEASSEDARVQLRELKTRQAVLGLNTRRQRLVLDNHALDPDDGDDRLRRAAEANPLMQGRTNYDPAGFDRLLEGNTAEELTALREIAGRIVSQQLAADPAPAAIDIHLPERGTLLEFDRGIQVDGDRPMTLHLDLRRSGHPAPWLAAALLIALGAAAGTRIKPPEKPAEKSLEKPPEKSPE